MQSSNIFSKFTAIIVPNELVSIINSIVDKFTSVSKNEENINIQAPFMPPPPVNLHQTSIVLPPPALYELLPLPPPPALASPPPQVIDALPPPPPALTALPPPSVLDVLSLVPESHNINIIKRGRGAYPEVDILSNNLCSLGVHCFYEECKLIHFPIHKCRHEHNCNRNITDKSCGFIHDEHESVINRLENNKFELYKGWEKHRPFWSRTAEGRANHFKKNVIKSNTSNHNVCVNWNWYCKC